MIRMDTSFDVRLCENSAINQVDFNNIAFGKVFSDHVFVMDYLDGEWQKGSIEPYGPMSMSPASMVFHYGQAIFEGMKAYRQQDGNASLFRPGDNIKRFNLSAVRMSMPEVPADIFMQALVELVGIDNQWVPSKDDASLYIRPFMFATDSHVGVRASHSYRFMIFTCPVGAYYSKAVRVKVETEYTRAAMGGTGAAKAAGNYAGSLYPTKLAGEQGYDQLLWTDASSHKFIEECGTMNAAFVVAGKLLVPATSDTILDGVTRKSAIQLAKDLGITVEERAISVLELEEAAKAGTLTEAFGLGTAATVSVMCTIGFKNCDFDLPSFDTWTVAPQIKTTLENLRRGYSEDPYGWNIPV
ncbi:MAG: branched chain amino acid aminotransferase [Crocinitomicaceae bacterium]|nr:branched chain amino acid aminotransferase [Crocinitomicaceae bacterium]